MLCNITTRKINNGLGDLLNKFKMIVKLREITQSNYYEVCLLTTNADGMPTFDEEYVCANSVSIAESKYYPNLHTRAIYQGDTAVGFMLFGPYEEDENNFWLLRYMIDYRYRGKGFGKAAFEAFLKEVEALNSISTIYLGLYPENEIAKALYTSFGFVFTGREKDEEHIYKLDLNK
ncbi:uncharacterized protein CHSO_3326 [Chryseobacterium sp. StRB126]|nr:uncharacterized protein CHSO_3326 [Chryseobacterium sp. StRB126]